MNTLQKLARLVIQAKTAPDPGSRITAANTALATVAARLPGLGAILDLAESSERQLKFSVRWRHESKRLSYHKVKVRTSLTGETEIRVSGLPEHAIVKEHIKRQFQAGLEREV